MCSYISAHLAYNGRCFPARQRKSMEYLKTHCLNIVCCFFEFLPAGLRTPPLHLASPNINQSDSINDPHGGPLRGYAATTPGTCSAPNQT